MKAYANLHDYRESREEETYWTGLPSMCCSVFATGAGLRSPSVSLTDQRPDFSSMVKSVGERLSHFDTFDMVVREYQRLLRKSNETLPLRSACVYVCAGQGLTEAVALGQRCGGLNAGCLRPGVLREA